MQIFTELQKLVSNLNPYRGSWALCGGVVASIYRETPRFTGDIDVALIDSPHRSSDELATEVLGQMGYAPIPGFVPDPRGGGDQVRALLCGRESGDRPFVGIDFLLPVFPWVPRAVERAQFNLVDFGFAEVPTVTIEDLILSKLNALQAPEPRPQDIDDIQCLLASTIAIDGDYLVRESRLLKLPVPEWVLSKLSP